MLQWRKNVSTCLISPIDFQIVVSSLGLNKYGVDNGVHAHLRFPGGKVASFATSILGDLNNTATISASKLRVRFQVKNKSICDQTIYVEEKKNPFFILKNLTKTFRKSF